MTARIGAQVRRLRRHHDWTGDHVVDALELIGVTISRDALANLETGRRDTISLGEWFALAAVLNVPPGALLLPDPAADVAVLPTRPAIPGVLLLEWINGGERVSWDLLTAPEEDVEAAERIYRAAAFPLEACRTHDELVMDLLLAEAHQDAEDGERRYRRAVGQLAEHRNAMQLAGWTLPYVPDDVARVLAAVDRHPRPRLGPSAAFRPRATPTNPDTANTEENRS